MRIPILGAATVLTALLLSAAIGSWRFGSTTNAIAYLNGRYILTSHEVANLGSVEPDTEIDVTFDLTNVSSQPIRLVGANCSCSCLLPPSMPMDLPGGETTPITFRFHTPETEMDFEQLIDLYFDGAFPAVQLSIRGKTQ